MTLRQLHYTSAPPGPDGSGFRFTATSPDTDPALLRLAEPLLGYEPPRDSPARPTEAELPAFPVAFGFSLLPDGTGVLSRTRYTGADYSGRYGNFHAHALLVPPGAGLPGGMLPIAAWESPDWRTVTPVDGAPPLAAVSPGDRIGRQQLTAFARRRAERLAPFLSDVRRLFEDERAPTLVMVEEGAEEVALWVALACAALPPAYAPTLTFTTYTRRPYLAEQQIVGVLADAEFGYASADLGHQFRFHHCLGGTSSDPRTAPWAAVAARVWLAGRPDLLVRAAADAPFDAEVLASRALYEGIPLEAAGRAAGTAWALRHADRQDETFWQRFLETLLTEDTDGTGTDALPGLLDALAAQWPPEVTEPLARDTVRAAIDGRGAVPSSLHSALTPEACVELARELGPRLTVLLADPHVPTERLLTLLSLGETLATHLVGHPPPAAPGVRLADHLLARAADGAPGSGPSAREVAAAVSGHGSRGVRGALLDRLNDVALSGDPIPVVPVLAGLDATLDPAELADYPHLRAAAAAGRGTRDPDSGLRMMNRLIREAKWQETADPSVLRTAFLLTWPGRRPSMDDALMLLAQTPPDLLTASGLDHQLARTALAADAADPDAPEVARALLSALPPGLGLTEPRVRDGLNLLLHAEDIRTGHAERGFTAYAIALRDRARPLDDSLERRLARGLVARILSGATPESSVRPGVAGTMLRDELEQLVRFGDEGLMDTYEAEARSSVTLDRLQRDPSHLAALFIAWNSFGDFNPAWDRVRLRLLDQFLKPAVRRLPEPHLSAAESELTDVSSTWAERWRDWYRPGLARRWGRRRGSGAGGARPSKGWRDAGPGTVETQPGAEEH
ncbi:GTPase-associated protein 1-related protein [Streptomyces sp. NBC_00038]|uniref:GTPase-associated protein 1-related protein n=1 Tax=Streptomyces sp. NBC_00038 TaxID=2903615 RepID=UPI00225096FF|nr:GTPase-associated protein 1-related protein [Streptomyces sp. NBC_00038]MCX5562237.1 GTPase-associated protein 1-related protein [Streptomyces sp. NBC_00038]